MNRSIRVLPHIIVALIAAIAASAGEPSMSTLERQFRELPMEARRLTGPLFWLHGDKSRRSSWRPR
jgi:hypothetical protein